MFVSFEPLLFLAWVFISAFIPGAILSFSILRKHEGLSLLEKLLIGFGLGVVILPMPPFLLYFLFGVKYSYGLALLSVAFLYVVAIAFLVKNRAYEGILPPADFKPEINPGIAIPIVLVALLLLSFMVRFGSYGPIFQELDPYFYTYSAYQLLTLGENPMSDATAWYPDVEINHRFIPALGYLEAVWYSLYTGGAECDNMLLAVTASMYPPIVAVLAVFFIYLLVSQATKREWGLTAAALASFAPVFIYKLSAGEQEVQPFAFFTLFFFYAMYLLAMRRKDLRLPTANDLSFGADAAFPVMAGLAFAALSLGSSSQILAVLSAILFMGGYAVIVFLRDEDGKGLLHLLAANSVIFIMGPLLASAVLKPMFVSGELSLSIAAGYLALLAFVGLLYAVKRALPDRAMGAAALAGILLFALLLYAFSPAGDAIRNMGKAGFEIAKFNSPLDRTIAEQGVAATTFSGQIGFIAESYDFPIALNSVDALASALMFLALLLFSAVANVVLAIFVAFANLFLGTDVEFGEKAVSFLLFWIFMFWVACIYAAWRFTARDDKSMFILFLAIIMPPFVVGLIKAKYTIYSAVLLAVAIGFVLGQAEDAVGKLVKGESLRASIHLSLILIAVALVALQFFWQGFAPSLALGSLAPLYQNNPDALAPKFQQFCDSSGDPDVCAAASDPMGHASRGTNYQYDMKLCMLSVFSNYSFIYGAPAEGSFNRLAYDMQYQSAAFRCQRLSEYWVDSMEWLRYNTPEGARVTSWWDYGHWINYFGLRNAVIRNEHASHKMIGEVAHAYLDSTPEELKAWMQAHGSEYALFDIELVSGGGSLGGKYGALNYLSCAHNNETTVAKGPGESQCEAEHLWETIFVSNTPCTISELTGKSGFTAYKMYAGGSYMPYYPTFCMAPEDANTLAYCRQVVRAVPAYCVGNVTLATGETTFGTYYLNETSPNGDLKLNKALLQLPYQLPTTLHMGPVTGVTLFYTDTPVWLENGEVKGGYEDRKGKFYDSAIYRATFLGELPGFTMAYQTPDGAVKIYKIDG